jgi:2-polyprenyl-3-methyl-5-hydroxy-6-metoxy-1,4-benzoquinol methylase
MNRVQCCICDRQVRIADAESAVVRSNVRAFSRERFRVWRCPGCESIHASEEVDLAHYYAQYPFHSLKDDWRLRTVYGSQLARLKAAGVEKTQRILDYGCGNGGFVRYLQEHGFTNAVGFDAFNPEFANLTLLTSRYDCILAQDVLEHVKAPRALLAQFAKMLLPGAVVFIGTPNADAVDLDRADGFLHALHVPYHRHIFSRRALLMSGSRQGWQLERHYPTMYTNTNVPFLNEAFYTYYGAALDNSLDAILGPVEPWQLLARLPLTLFWAIFGAAFSRGTDGCAVFRSASE